MRAGAAIVAALIVLLMLPMAGPGLVRLAAHDIPADVLVQIFARPEGQRLHVLVRVPLAAMRDVTFPTRDGVVFLDVSDTARLDAALREAARLWIVPALTIDEDGRSLEAPTITTLRVSLPSDRSFADFETASGASPTTAAAGRTRRCPGTRRCSTSRSSTPIASERAGFAIDPGGRALRSSCRHRAAVPRRRAIPSAPSSSSAIPGQVALDPRWHQAAWRFVRLGFDHILDGFDHLLFLFCLVLPARGLWSLAVVVTAFTVAHSITLFSAAFGYAPDALWFPPLVETLIAVSIVYMALENIVLAVRPEGVARPGVSRRWTIAFGFGLVHGFGFSFALRETLQFAGAHVLTSLFAFNVGVELGQLLVVALVAPLLWLVFRFVVPQRVGIVIASALAAHTAWHWMIERGSTLAKYQLVAARSCGARDRGQDTHGRRGGRRGALGLDAAPRAAGGHRGSAGIDVCSVRFWSEMHRKAHVGTQQFITLDITLEVGTLAETVITGRSPLIDVERVDWRRHVGAPAG